MTTTTSVAAATAKSVDPAIFREAMTRFASGVTIVTTVDSEGRSHGFTATAFSSVSATPPLVLVCLDKSARCHPEFLRATEYSISILRSEHWDIAMRFASKIDDKFTSGFVSNEYGLSHLPDALVSLVCLPEQVIDAGDHTVLIGRVVSVELGDGAPAVFYGRKARELRDEQSF
ncbi:flavin reductase family protein [Arthrobacter sp. I2-34]|uniref:Flavin reductase family protein n=1 Tax=Arthrobacter hankyongi TaxID=2904801 RepID=A0ABS9LCL0_9MICC|nr:flavin reductase family protein [Arthrobacter hankyongi]MCG2624421.1 flavin reductase family protein [Arthrobacter hankyongi]